MRYLSLISGIILFLLALGFALKNSDSVTLHYFLGYQWQAPLILVLMAAFCLGTAAGIAATLGLIFKQRREIQKLRRETKSTTQSPVPGLPSLRQAQRAAASLRQQEGETLARSARFKQTERPGDGI
ncbi:MAG: DUF1049 domain-containing protein [Nitrosomonadales bacterium]|nr:MAG: DUF1049 domain-containing protein [Nitrosomonadales bacterium]